jgi:hypothetical protein
MQALCHPFNGNKIEITGLTPFGLPARPVSGRLLAPSLILTLTGPLGCANNTLSSLPKDQLPVSLRSPGKVFTFWKLILRHCLRDSANIPTQHFRRAPKAQPQDDRFLKEDLLKPQTDTPPTFDMEF